MKKPIVVLPLLLLIAACTGGDDRGRASTASPLTSLSSAQTKSTAQGTDGSSQGSDAASSATGNVGDNGQNVKSQDGGGITVSPVSGGGTLDPTGGTLRAATGDDLGGSGVDPVVAMVSVTSKDKAAEILDPNAPVNPLDYQSFGAWVTGEEVRVNAAGTGSVVSATLGTPVPTADSATLVVNAALPLTNGMASANVVTVTANVDLSQRSIGSVTGGTVAASLNSGGDLTATGLSVSSTLVNSPVTTSLGAVVGTVSGTIANSPATTSLGAVVGTVNSLAAPAVGTVSGSIR